jgi:hypothetical protein
MGGIPDSLGATYPLLILLPGFITTFVERSLAFEREPSGTAIIAKSLMYSVVNYALFSLTRLDLISWPLTPGRDSINVSPHPLGMFVLLSIAVVTGVVTGLFKTHDWHMRAARRLKLTKRTSRSSLWSDIFHEVRCKESPHSAFVTVTLRDGSQLFGWPEYYSDDYTEGPVLFLCQVESVTTTPDGKEQRNPVPCRGILLNGSNVKSIVFQERSKEETGNGEGQRGDNADPRAGAQPATATTSEESSTRG